MRPGNLTVILKIALTFAGTLIGAGFASGQELLQFFITYGSFGFGGICFAGLLFSFLAWRLLSLSRQFALSSYTDLIALLCGRRFAAVFQWVIACFLFTVLTIMLAGVGNIAGALFQLPPHYGYFPFALLILWANSGGFSGITRINTCVTPFLALIIVVVSMSSLAYHGFSPDIFKQAVLHAHQPAPHWLLGCLLYVSYNMALSSTILVPLAKTTSCNSALTFGSCLGGVILTVLSFLIVTVLCVHSPDIFAKQFPMLEISCSQNHFHAALYTAVLMIAIFTTSLSCLYGCAEKVSAAFSINNSVISFFLILVALCFANIGFSQLIAVFFPYFGYICLWLLFRLFLPYNRKS